MPKRALIVIDVQNEYFVGALPISDPPPDQSLANIGRAMDVASAADVPVQRVLGGETDPAEHLLAVAGRRQRRLPGRRLGQQ